MSAFPAMNANPYGVCFATACRAASSFASLRNEQSELFFSTFLSSQSIRLSFCNSAISPSRSDWVVGFSGSRRLRRIQRLCVEKPTPKSAASCLRCIPLVNVMRTASARKSSVGRIAIYVLPYGTIRGQRSGRILWQVHHAKKGGAGVPQPGHFPYVGSLLIASEFSRHKELTNFQIQITKRHAGASRNRNYIAEAEPPL